MDNREKAMLERLGLSEADAQPKEKVITDEERINDIELAVCELFEMLSE